VGRRLRAELDGVVEIHAFGGGYCGLSFVEEDRVNVCMLLTNKLLKALPSSEWNGLLLALGEANPLLRGRFEALIPCDDEEVHAVGGIPFSSKERAAGPALLTGDAAGMVAPFSGGGQAMALSSGVLLARLILAHPVKLTARGFQGLAGRWNRVWQSNFGRQMRLGRWLQGLILSPIAMEVVAGTLTRVPYVARYLVRLTRA
ncbi:MAG: hypothetical protein O7H41_09725, partial [Planctomycetota bacterium]|nr:hypothetical protein [Planctomycetota bacterium]